MSIKGMQKQGKKVVVNEMKSMGEGSRNYEDQIYEVNDNFSFSQDPLQPLYYWMGLDLVQTYSKEQMIKQTGIEPDNFLKEEEESINKDKRPRKSKKIRKYQLPDTGEYKQLLSPEIRRSQTQGIDFFNQMPRKWMKAMLIPEFEQKLIQYDYAYKSRYYLFILFGAVMFHNNGYFNKVFCESIRVQISVRRQKIERFKNLKKYTVGLSYLFNVELNYVEKALTMFFDEHDYGKAIELVYIRDKTSEQLQQKTVTDMIKACQLFEKQYVVQVANSYYKNEGKLV